jgi:hypothetical protein
MSLQLKSDDRYLKHELPRLCQGDILHDLEVVEWARIIDDACVRYEVRRWALVSRPSGPQAFEMREKDKA